MRASKRSFKPNLISKEVKFADGKKAKIKVSARVYKKLR
jgi:ribosomal protein L28